VTPVESVINACIRSAAALAIISLAAGSTRAQTTERVSVSTAGVEGNSESFGGSISADGRFIAFASAASNFVVGVNAGVFLRDRLAGTTELASVSTGGAPGNDGSGSPSITADARFIAFESNASNLVAGDTNGLTDIFVRDRASGTTELVSVGPSGVQGDSACYSPSISADGRFIAFASAASNLVVSDTNGVFDIFVRDRQSGTTQRVSVSSAGAQGDNHSSQPPSISADGRYVAFTSSASNLVAGDTNAAWDIFVHDLQSGTTERVNLDPAGAQTSGDSIPHGSPSLSADGRLVAFASYASNLVVGDTNATLDVFVRDRTSSTNERVSVGSGGTEANYGGGEYGFMISADGRFVAFESIASNLVVGDTNAILDVFVHERQTASTERASVDSSGAQANQLSILPSISADGRFVVFQSIASNLVTADTNGDWDVFAHGPSLRPNAYCTSSTSSHGCSASIAASENPSLSFANSCDITITNVESLKPGIVFYGIDNAGFSPSAWTLGGTSWLCVKAPTQRTPLQNSGGTFGACDGSFVLDWNAYQSGHPLALGNPWSIGDKVYVQAWFRDPPAAKGSSLSNALELTCQP